MIYIKYGLPELLTQLLTKLDPQVRDAMDLSTILEFGKSNTESNLLNKCIDQVMEGYGLPKTYTPGLGGTPSILDYKLKSLSKEVLNIPVRGAQEHITHKDTVSRGWDKLLGLVYTYRLGDVIIGDLINIYSEMYYIPESDLDTSDVTTFNTLVRTQADSPEDLFVQMVMLDLIRLSSGVEGNCDDMVAREIKKMIDVRYELDRILTSDLPSGLKISKCRLALTRGVL